jgi:hypothetical protein
MPDPFVPATVPGLPLTACVKGRVYKVYARSFAVVDLPPVHPFKLISPGETRVQYAVFDGKEFLGVRNKFGSTYLFPERHWDTGAPFGTVREVEDTGIDAPTGVALHEDDEELFKFMKAFPDLIAAGNVGAPRGRTEGR